MRRYQVEAVAAYRRRGVYIDNHPSDVALYNTCWVIAGEKGDPWVKVTPRRKYASITMDMCSGDLSIKGAERVAALIQRQGCRVDLVGPAYVWVRRVDIHKAGNLADLILAACREDAKARA